MAKEFNTKNTAMKLMYFATFICLSLLTAYGQKDSIDSQAIFDNFFNEGETNQPDCATLLYPVKATKDTVDCTLSVELPDEGSLSPVRITLKCNHLPDNTPPTVTADGQVLERLSESSSLQIKDGVKSHEYSCHYKFCPTHDGNFTCQATDLTFDGISYTNTLTFYAQAIPGSSDVQPTAKSSKGIPKAGIILLLIGCFALSYLVFKVRFRKETGADFATFVRQHHRLPLNADWASTHYGLSQMTGSLAVAIIILYAWEYATGRSMTFLLVFALILLAIGTLSWYCQKRKLYFKEIRISLGKEDIFDAVKEVGEKEEWSLDYAGEDCIVAHTNPSIWSMTWGEQIFIVFDEGRIWVNSINDLNKRTNIISFIRTKRNVWKVEEAVRRKGNALRDARTQ